MKCSIGTTINIAAASTAKTPLSEPILPSALVNIFLPSWPIISALINSVLPTGTGARNDVSSFPVTAGSRTNHINFPKASSKAHESSPP